MKNQAKRIDHLLEMERVKVKHARAAALSQFTRDEKELIMDALVVKLSGDNLSEEAKEAFLRFEESGCIEAINAHAVLSGKDRASGEELDQRLLAGEDWRNIDPEELNI